MNMEVRLKELDEEIKKIQSEESRLQGRKELLNEELGKKIGALKELGIEFESREDLIQKAEEIESILNTSLDSLERKLEQYNEVKVKSELPEL